MEATWFRSKIVNDEEKKGNRSRREERMRELLGNVILDKKKGENKGEEGRAWRREQGCEEDHGGGACESESVREADVEAGPGRVGGREGTGPLS